MHIECATNDNRKIYKECYTGCSLRNIYCDIVNRKIYIMQKIYKFICLIHIELHLRASY